VLPLLLALGIIVISGCAALIVCSKPKLSSLIGSAGTALGCVLGMIPSLEVLLQGTSRTLRCAWTIPYGSFFIALDGLSAFFLLPIFLLGALAAIYGGQYLMKYKDTKRLGVAWFFYALLVASMVMVCLARNAVLFLLAWEIMALSSFFLVAFENEKPEVRRASWIYMVATHLGTACLLPMFLIFGAYAGSLDFDRFGHSLPQPMAGICFILALIGFGTKAGIIPFHVWLPEAHPAAPSHVSALMSGIMIKTGIYGLVRMLMFFGMPPLWWGWLVLAVGIVSGVLGVLFALAQHDLKGLLAYHSVENIGIIMMGLGVGLIGWSAGVPAVAILGMAGGLLHVVNHALFKSLLFLGAGAVFQAARTREIDHLGGLIKKMPYTGACFLIAAVAISGLPPLNGFLSEFLIYLGSLRGAVSLGPAVAVPLIGAVAGLALIGGLAAACFAKAFGIVFLGEPRSRNAADAHEAKPLMLAPMLALAAGCTALGFLGFCIVPAMAGVVSAVLGFNAAGELAAAGGYLGSIAAGSLALLLLAAALAGLRRLLLSGREVGSSVTWDCGYGAPSARMQYSASSFAQPITDLFKMFLRTEKHLRLSGQYFPGPGAFKTHTRDMVYAHVYRPLFLGVKRLSARFAVLQHGSMHLYVLYIVMTLLVLLVWMVR
jgi:formate hydrogenlyase subunit 3/multisubunit Na+/H+ antiporter MnhD subunit